MNRLLNYLLLICIIGLSINISAVADSDYINDLEQQTEEYNANNTNNEIEKSYIESTASLIENNFSVDSAISETTSSSSSEELTSDYYSLYTDPDMSTAYSQILPSKDSDINYSDFVSEYILMGEPSLDTYINTVNDLLTSNSQTDDKKWYYNTGTNLPQKTTYSGNLLSKVKKGDIIYEGNGSWGISGHAAIVEGVFYSTTYKQFYIRLIESIGDGVCRSVLSNARMLEKAGALLRPNSSSVNGKIINDAIKFCISQLGKGYLLDLNHDTSSSTSGWYSSELVWAAYKNQGIELEVIPSSYTNEPGITPHDLYHSSALTNIGYSSTESPSFYDINNHWAKANILYIAKNGLMSGTSLTLFSPDNLLTRAMAITTIYKLAGTPTDIGRNTFSDVNQSSYYAVPVSWAVAHSITSGTSTNTFSPNNYVTREQLAVFLYRFASYKGFSTSFTNSSLNKYTDSNSISSYAVNAMKWAISKNLLSGTSSTTLSPKANCTRAQTATIINNFITNLM